MPNSISSTSTSSPSNTVSNTTTSEDSANGQSVSNQSQLNNFPSLTREIPRRISNTYAKNNRNMRKKLRSPYTFQNSSMLSQPSSSSTARKQAREDKLKKMEEKADEIEKQVNALSCKVQKIGLTQTETSSVSSKFQQTLSTLNVHQLISFTTSLAQSLNQRNGSPSQQQQHQSGRTETTDNSQNSMSVKDLLEDPEMVAAAHTLQKLSIAKR